MLTWLDFRAGSRYDILSQSSRRPVSDISSASNTTTRTARPCSQSPPDRSPRPSPLKDLSDWFAFLLDLALAHYRNDLGALVSRLEEDQAALDAGKPQPPTSPVAQLKVQRERPVIMDPPSLARTSSHGVTAPFQNQSGAGNTFQLVVPGAGHNLQESFAQVSVTSGTSDLDADVGISVGHCLPVSAKRRSSSTPLTMPAASTPRSGTAS